MAVLALFVMLCQGTWVLAGTTGSLSGLVSDDSGAGIAGAKVSVASPSQSSTTTTDANGRYSFISLSPDTYVLTVEKPGFDVRTVTGITVTSDQNQTYNIPTRKTLQTIGRTGSRANSDLVRAGQVNDVYSVNAATTDKAQGFGGGSNLNNAYSALAAVPGVTVLPGQTGGGTGLAVYIRGGDYDQIGYEYDGVPVNRAFDSYAGHTAPTLGQQELQVFTAGAPASASASGIAGYINQVVRSGTYPAFSTLQLDIGGPSFYHKAGFEYGGANPSRTFSYYIGVSGWNQAYRYQDQYNGGNAQSFVVADNRNPNGTSGFGGTPFCVNGGSPFAAGQALPAGMSSDPGCIQGGTANLAFAETVRDREVISNFHFAIPKKDGSRDDIQLLYTTSALYTDFYGSPQDFGTQNIIDGFGGPLTYHDAYAAPKGTGFGQSAIGFQAVPYYFPNSPTNRAFKAPLPTNARDVQNNDATIFKLQYQHNIGTKAYLRVFGYTYYSDWLQNGTVNAATGGSMPDGSSDDYELISHTRGAGLNYVNQLNDKNLLTFAANYTTASVIRYNNATDTQSLKTQISSLLDANGNCYNKSGAIGACNDKATQGQLGTPTPFAITGAAAAAGASWTITNSGFTGAYNAVTPKFSSFALTDEFKPTSKLTISLGARYESYVYDLASTSDPGRNFWYTKAQQEFCYDTTTFLVKSKSTLGACPAGQVHPDGTGGNLLVTNDYPTTETNTAFSPRLGISFQVNPDVVLRASAGKFTQPISSAFTQYNRLELNVASYDARFLPFGFTAPGHQAKVQSSDNYDFSYSQHLRGTDFTFRATPYLRSTQNQVLNVPLDPKVPYVTGLNVGKQTSTGVEIGIQKGDFNRDGIAGFLSITPNVSKIKYGNSFAGGRNLIDVINDNIKGYNALTSAGGGAPCYSNAGDGTTASCGSAGAIFNPYYAKAAQPLLDRNGSYYPFTTFPLTYFFGSTSNDQPLTIAGAVQFKKKRFSVTPNFQYLAGSPYGSPLNLQGIDPSTCTNNQAGVPSAVAAGIANHADYTSCGGTVAIPNPETNSTFDQIGQFRQPDFLNINATFTYDVTPKVRANLILSNLVSRCFRGSQTSWSSANGGKSVCGYGNAAGYVSNFYNGTSPNDISANGYGVNPIIAHPYTATGYSFPFNAYLQFSFKL